MKKTILLAMLILCAGMSGCIGDSEEPTVEIPLMRGSHDVIQSHQFNNTGPMAMGQQSVGEVNVTNTSVSLYLNVTLLAHFHEPTFWSQGWVNVTILDENDTIVWSNQTNDGEHHYNLELFNHTGNLTYQVTAEGSDDQLDDEVPDYYVVEYNLTYYWREI